jgi:hypothetical protein
VTRPSPQAVEPPLVFTGAVDQQSEVPLGTAQWMGLREANARLSFRPHTPSDRIWLGEACVAASTPLGYADDRCVSVVPAVSRAPALSSPTCACGRAPASIPKVILPSTTSGGSPRRSIVRENKNDPFFEDAARNLLKGLILHVLTAPGFDDIRNLITVRRLLTQGDWLRIALLREAGEENLPSGFVMLWKAMQRSTAFDGIVAGIGEQMLTMAERTRSGVLETARTNTTFLDGAPMRHRPEGRKRDRHRPAPRLRVQLCPWNGTGGSYPGPFRRGAAGFLPAGQFQPARCHRSDCWRNRTSILLGSRRPQRA